MDIGLQLGVPSVPATQIRLQLRITAAQPGDLFVLRNAGNLVPAFGATSGGEVATIEFAVTGLRNVAARRGGVGRRCPRSAVVERSQGVSQRWVEAPTCANAQVLSIMRPNFSVPKEAMVNHVLMPHWLQSRLWGERGSGAQQCA